jgi:serine/threonine protein kinase
MRRIIDGRWEVSKELGSGGQGTAYRVADLNSEFGQPLVLKLRHLRRPSPRFRREVEVLERLDHPHLLTLLFKNIDLEQPYFITPFIAGGDMKEREAEIRSLSVESRLAFFKVLLEAVAYVHQADITHRDIKPNNIFVNEFWQPVLGDFGLAYVEEGERFTQLVERVGPWGFIAPELMSGRLENIAPACDVYSLGLLLHWMLSRDGILPLWDEHRARYNLEAQYQDHRYAGVNAFLDSCVRRDPKLRFPNGQAMLNGFSMVLDIWENGVLIDGVVQDFYEIVRFVKFNISEMQSQFRNADERRVPASMRQALHGLVTPWRSVKQNLIGFVDERYIGRVNAAIENVTQMSSMLPRDVVRSVSNNLNKELNELIHELPSLPSESVLLDKLKRYCSLDEIVQVDKSFADLQAYFRDVRLGRQALGH